MTGIKCRATAATIVFLLFSATVHAETGKLVWDKRDFNGAKSSGMPLCVYVQDPNSKSNLAKELMGKLCLGNADVREKLTPFLKFRVKTTGNDAKVWPADVLRHACNGAALMLCSSDFSQMVFIDNITAKSQLHPENIINMINNILSYEEHKKGAKQSVALAGLPKLQPPADPTPTQTGNLSVPGLNSDISRATQKSIEDRRAEEKKQKSEADE